MVPVFTKGLKQLDPIDDEETRGIPNVRILVERVIRLLRRKNTILEGILPTDFLSSNHRGTLDYQVPLIDRILRVCSVLVNLCPPIVPFDLIFYFLGILFSNDGSEIMEPNRMSVEQHACVILTSRNLSLT